MTVIICHVSVNLSVYIHHYWEIGKSRPIYPHPSKQCTTGRGLLFVNVLFAMLITVTVFFQVIEQRILCHRLEYIRKSFIISILYIISLEVYCLSEANWGGGGGGGGVPIYFPPVVCLQHISNWQHHFLCSRRSTEHIYKCHYLYSFHAHGTRFSALSVRTSTMEFPPYSNMNTYFKLY